MGVGRMGLALVLAAGLAGCAPGDQAQSGPIEKGGTEALGEYTSPEGWWKSAPDHTDPADCPSQGFGGGQQASRRSGPCWGWGEVSGMAADSPNRIIVAVWGDREQTTGEQRVGGSNYMMEVDANGNITKRWTKWDSLFNTPHEVYISPYDPDRAIYVVERGGARPSGKEIHEAVYKFTNDGETLLWGLVDPQPKLSGQEQRAMENLGHTDFGNPSVLTFLPDGEHFLLADGYDNGRVQTWTVDGEWVSEFGEVDHNPDPNVGAPGAFDLMHGIAVDRAGRIYVGDRRNNRVQVFTPEGEFIEEWPNVIDITGIFIDNNEAVWVLSAAANRLLKFNTQGQLQYYFGTHGRTSIGIPGGFARPHQVDVDQDGNVYVASWDWPGFISRLSPKPGADPSKLMTQVIGTGSGM